MHSISVARFVCATACVVILLQALSGCKRNDGTQPTAMPVTHTVLPESALLATIAENEQPDSPNQNGHASQPASGNQTAHMVIEMNRHGRGVAYIARVPDGVRVVHNGTAGKSYQEIETNTLTLSPDSKRVAYCAKSANKWYVIVDGREYGPFEDKGPPVFSPDSRHVAYEAQIGSLWHVFVDDAKSDGVVSYFDKPIFSGDSRRLLLRENTRDDSTYRLVFSDLSFKQSSSVVVKGMFTVVSDDNSRMAIIDNVQGKKQVKLFSFTQPDKPEIGPVYDEVLALSFSKDARHYAYTAKKGERFHLIFDGREEPSPSGLFPWPTVIRPDAKGVGLIIVDEEKGAFVHQAFFDDGNLSPEKYKECADLTYSQDGRYHAYVAIRNERFMIVNNGKEGPMFDRVIAPQFSPDGKYLVYRARQNDKRFVVVADAATGKILKEQPRYERVFETTFTSDGGSVAYGVKDGKQIWWKVEKL